MQIRKRQPNLWQAANVNVHNIYTASFLLPKKKTSVTFATTVLNFQISLPPPARTPSRYFTQLGLLLRQLLNASSNYRQCRLCGGRCAAVARSSAVSRGSTAARRPITRLLRFSRGRGRINSLPSSLVLGLQWPQATVLYLTLTRPPTRVPDAVVLSIPNSLFVIESYVGCNARRRARQGLKQESPVGHKPGGEPHDFCPHKSDQLEFLWGLMYEYGNVTTGGRYWV